MGCSVNDKHIDWVKVLHKIERRVTNAEVLGPLSVLKQNEILDEEVFERVERNLAERIFEYLEYEEPVNECIRQEDYLPANQWERITGKLSAAFDKFSDIEDWRGHLKRELILPDGKWEEIEDSLFGRIDKHEGTSPKIFSWPAWWIFQSYRMPRSVAATVLVIIFALAGSLFLNRGADSLPTYVYQAQGADFELVGKVLEENFLQSSKGSSINIVNRHGYTSLQNGAAVKLEKITGKSARYRLTMAEGSGRMQDGKATFFVTGHKREDGFVVGTPDYDISVLGTFFTVFPDLEGKMSTQVMEGRVRIKNSTFGDTVLTAGQSLNYDQHAGKYVIRDNGPVVSRVEIDLMPDVETITKHVPVTLSSNIPFADVSVDGEYKGTAPLRILLSPGDHNVRISRDGFVAVDSIIEVNQGDTGAFHVYLKEPEPILSRVPIIQRNDPLQEVKKSITSDTIKKLLCQDPKVAQAQKAKELLNRAQNMETQDWAKALKTYEKIIKIEHAPSLVRESAMFSIGRLKVDNIDDGSEGREAFLSYLALYPNGIFTRESLLRLAELEFQKDQDKAIEYYLKYFEKYPNHYRVSDLQYRVGLIYLQKKKYDEAVYMIKQSLANMLYDQPREKERRYVALYKALVGKGDTAHANLVKKY